MSETGGIFKKIEVKDATWKYGFKQQGYFALEPIKKGEAIFRCILDDCDYLRIEKITDAYTRDETLEIFKEYPKSVEFIHRYSYMVDDDLFDWPRGWKDSMLTETCMFFNHSCDPNCGFASIDTALVVAIRDIEIGEELTYDYQLMDSEASFYTGLDCKCGSYNCRGILKFDEYRNVDWSIKYYKYCGNYIKKRIDELKTKWFSSRCYIKYCDKEKTQKGLFALKKIAKNELVAIYSQDVINEKSHYLRHNDNPTCYIDGNEVFALINIEPETELTLKFN